LDNGMLALPEISFGSILAGMAGSPGDLCDGFVMLRPA
jgi:hypothetical protein